MANNNGATGPLGPTSYPFPHHSHGPTGFFHGCVCTTSQGIKVCGPVSKESLQKYSVVGYVGPGISSTIMPNGQDGAICNKCRSFVQYAQYVGNKFICRQCK